MTGHASEYSPACVSPYDRLEFHCGSGGTYDEPLEQDVARLTGAQFLAAPGLNWTFLQTGESGEANPLGWSLGAGGSFGLHVEGE